MQYGVNRVLGVAYAYNYDVMMFPCSCYYVMIISAVDLVLTWEQNIAVFLIKGHKKRKIISLKLKLGLLRDVLARVTAL